MHGSQDEVGTTKHNWSALEALQDPRTETGGGYGTRQHFSSPHLDAILRSAVSGHHVTTQFWPEEVGYRNRRHALTDRDTVTR